MDSNNPSQPSIVPAITIQDVHAIYEKQMYDRLAAQEAMWKKREADLQEELQQFRTSGVSAPL